MACIFIDYILFSTPDPLAAKQGAHSSSNSRKSSAAAAAAAAVAAQAASIADSQSSWLAAAQAAAKVPAVVLAPLAVSSSASDAGQHDGKCLPQGPLPALSPTVHTSDSAEAGTAVRIHERCGNGHGGSAIALGKWQRSLRLSPSVLLCTLGWQP